MEGSWGVGAMEDTRECREGSEQGNGVLKELGRMRARTQEHEWKDLHNTEMGHLFLCSCTEKCPLTETG